MRREQLVSMAVGCALAFVVSLSVALPAFADPPPHAPAHGWRRKHDPHYVGYTGHKWPRDYGVIGGNCDRAAIGAVLGGVVGGAVGTQIGSGSGRVVAIVTGTVLGAIIGHEIGEKMDEGDRACTGHALELAREGQRVHWVNRATGVSYVVTPTGKADGSCRSFNLEASRGGEAHTTKGRACRSGEATWRIAEAH